ncbi:MAG: hypothetical protein HYZ42_03655, partial [Bacteroidetes bacterium]|nr:hypothetical protein [Bacteroidota bacterium]
MESKSLQLPQKFKLAKDKIKEIEAKEDEDDSKSTHPNVGKRKDKIEALVKDDNSKDKKSDYIVGEAEFENVQKIARFEVCYLYLISGKYAKALYSGWLLQQKYSERKYSDKVILMALYGCSKNDNDDKSLEDVNTSFKDKVESDEESGSWKSIEGNSQSVYYFFDKLSAKELSVLCSYMAWRFKEKYREDDFLVKLSNDAIREMVFNYDIKYSSFIINGVEAKAEILDTVIDEEKKLTKTEKIKKLKKKSVKNEDAEAKKFWETAFQILEEGTLNALKISFKRYEKEFDDLYSKSNLDKTEKDIAANQKKQRLRGFSIGVDRIVMMPPVFNSYSKSGDTYQQNLLASDLYTIQEEKRLREIAAMSGLDIVMLDKKGTDEEILKNLNINNEIINWISEKLKYQDSTVVLFSDQYTNDLIKESGTEYLGISVVLSYPGYTNEWKNVKACLMTVPVIFNPVFAAWGLYGFAFGNRGYTTFTFVLFNVRTNRIELV